jgi:23S rRNA (adenine2503-C2)-methyltransferase
MASPIEHPGNLPEPSGLLPITRTSRDGDVVKYCQQTHDGHEIESVIVPMGAEVDGRDKTWRTLCVSSQIGCPWGCSFCHTGAMGFIRDLTTAEIVGQVHAARNMLGANVRNVVFMGMGEPLDNFDNVVAAIRTLHEDREHQIPRRRITVSTAGRCEGIRRLGGLGWRRLHLAVSLNAPNDEIRSQIMPFNDVEPMAVLREAIDSYPVRAGGHVLIEYVLIKGLNDQPEHARELVTYLAGLRTCVNLIPLNTSGLHRHEPPDDDTVIRFHQIVMEAGQLVFCRNTKGRRAMAACGQLGKPAAPGSPI